MEFFNNDTGKTLIFLHIEKTAGTTLRLIIERLYTRTEICSIYPNNPNYPSLEEYISLPDYKKNRLKIFFGHVPYGLHKYISRPCTYATVLRDPVERVTSMFSQLQSNKHAQLEYKSFHEHIKKENLTLKDFVTSGITDRTDNYQTRVISNRFPPFGDCSREMLEEAKKNLSESFAVLGLTERFDESVILMKRTFGWRTPFYVKTNVSGNRPQVDENAINSIKEYNSLDIELYRYASELFDEQVKNQGLSFKKEVEAFKIANSYTWEWVEVIEKKRAELKRVEAQISALKSSWSWRLAMPLRWILGAVKKMGS